MCIDIQPISHMLEGVRWVGGHKKRARPMASPLTTKAAVCYQDSNTQDVLSDRDYCTPERTLHLTTAPRNKIFNRLIFFVSIC